MKAPVGKNEICQRSECQIAGGCEHRTSDEKDCQYGWRWDVADELITALDELRSYAASVWFDEADATAEERELMRRSGLALGRARSETA